VLVPFLGGWKFIERVLYFNNLTLNDGSGKTPIEVQIGVVGGDALRNAQ